MKNIIAAISTLIVIGLMIYTYSNGTAYQGGKASHTIFTNKTTNISSETNINTTNEDLEEKKLKALRDKAGNTSSFEVSNEYRSKCASCHGVDGSGIQNGKKLMGPKLIGQEEEKLYKDLVDFKAGRKENLIMKGLLLNLSDEKLKEFAKEISEFKIRKEALEK